MSITSIIKEIKGQLGSISRNVFDVKFGYGLRSRSHRVGLDSFVIPVGAFKQICWADLPPEILREILARVEAFDGSRPDGQNITACAGVCQVWRMIAKEILKDLQASGKITYPNCLKQPDPRGSVIRCFIKRNRGNQTYCLYLSSSIDDDEKFLLVAERCRHPTYTDYVISLPGAGVSKRSSNYIGVLRSNFLANKFTLYDSQPPDANVFARMTECRFSQLAKLKQVSPRAPAGYYPVARIFYESNALGSRGVRRMQCVMDTIPISAMEPEGLAPTQTQFLTSSEDAVESHSTFRSKLSPVESSLSDPSSIETDEKLVLTNKSPGWQGDQQQYRWYLNFNGQGTASVKNFQLIASTGNEDIGQLLKFVLQFGKVEKDVFTMNYQYPLSAFQAFAICLSSFDIY